LTGFLIILGTLGWTILVVGVAGAVIVWGLNRLTADEIDLGNPYRALEDTEPRQ
jgi:hypothetical protein